MSFHPVHPGASFGTQLKKSNAKQGNEGKGLETLGLRKVRCHLDKLFHGPCHRAVQYMTFFFF